LTHAAGEALCRLDLNIDVAAFEVRPPRPYLDLLFAPSGLFYTQLVYLIAVPQRAEVDEAYQVHRKA
jgi:hypothetical protein